MILDVEHRLSYNYSDFVNLNPHYFYLTPNVTPFQQILSFELSVFPEPEKLTRNLDQEGNIQHISFVNSLTRNFDVKTKFSIESTAFNTFDFIFFPFEASVFPFKYPGKLAWYTDIYFSSNPVHSTVKAFGDKFAREVNNDTIDFLMAVTTYISGNFRYISRERGEAVSAEETLRSGSGSCRDFSVLMMAVCTSQGMVARFVSGYLYGSDRHQHDLHAWVEVFLPGGGWRGFDPTEGQVVNENYITLANSLEPTGINPVRGSFRGALGVTSELETQVSILERV